MLSQPSGLLQEILIKDCDLKIFRVNLNSVSLFANRAVLLTLPRSAPVETTCDGTFEVQTCLQTSGHSHIKCSFRSLNSRWRLRCNLFSKSDSFSHELVWRIYMVHQTNTQSLDRIYFSPGRNKFSCFALANHSRKSLGAITIKDKPV